MVEEKMDMVLRDRHWWFGLWSTEVWAPCRPVPVKEGSQGLTKLGFMGGLTALVISSLGGPLHPRSSAVFFSGWTDVTKHKEGTQ